MNGVAFIFPGQGAQSVGMGAALYASSPAARAVIDRADQALEGELELRRLIFEGPEEALRQTEVTQPALLAVSVAAHAALEELAQVAGVNSVPRCYAGHSLGEWSALVAAGALPLEAAVQAVRERGRQMQAAVPAGAGAMMAVMGLEADEVSLACAAAEAESGEVVSPANFNGPAQTVIAGSAAGVEAAAAQLRAAGARRLVALRVSAPFHCALMAPAAEAMREVIAALPLGAPRAPIVTNVSARLEADPERLRAALLDQIVAPVRWTESVQGLAAAGVEGVIELGPGRVLAGLVRRIEPSLQIASAASPEALEGLLPVLQEAA